MNVMQYVLRPFVITRHVLPPVIQLFTYLKCHYYMLQNIFSVVAIIKLRNLRLRKHEQLPVQFVCGTLVATWILEQKLLVIVLSIIPGSCCLQSSDNLLFFRSKMFLLHFLRHTTGNRLLFWGMEEYSGTIF